MDRIVDLPRAVQREVEDYARGKWHKMRVYPVSDMQRQTYTLLTIPEHDYPLDMKPQIIVLAQVKDDYVVIEQDITDKPLWEELVRVGVPCDKIICTYAGETLPAST